LAKKPTATEGQTDLDVKNFDKFSGRDASGHSRSVWASLLCILGLIFIGGPILVSIVEKLIQIVRGKQPGQSMENAWGTTMNGPFRVQAAYNYRAQTPHDLTFMEGDVIIVLEKRSNDWWVGELEVKPGQVGLFPSNRVTILDEHLLPKVEEIKDDSTNCRPTNSSPVK